MKKHLLPVLLSVLITAVFVRCTSDADEILMNNSGQTTPTPLSPKKAWGEFLKPNYYYWFDISNIPTRCLGPNETVLRAQIAIAGDRKKETRISGTLYYHDIWIWSTTDWQEAKKHLKVHGIPFQQKDGGLLDYHHIYLNLDIPYLRQETIN